MNIIILEDGISINQNITNEIKKIFIQGQIIAITTNDSYKNIETIISKINIYFHFLITNNGGIIVDKVQNQILKTPKTIKSDFVNSILRDVQLLNGIINIITSKKIFTNSSGFRNQAWLSKQLKEKYVNRFTKYNVGVLRPNEVIQLTVLLNSNLIKELLIFFQKFYGNEYHFSSTTANTIDINVAGVNTYESIKAIKLLYQIQDNEIFCFVDSKNNLELMINIENSYCFAYSDVLLKNSTKKIINLKNPSELTLIINQILNKNLIN